MKGRKLLIAAAACAVASTAMAWPGDPPPPPPTNDCSPGFWKNHTELWFGSACTGSTCDEWLGELQARGPGSSYLRLARASYLNAWADGYFGMMVCKD
jgi:hypothetical protein